jgi:hypothetical protein
MVLDAGHSATLMKDAQAMLEKKDKRSARDEGENNSMFRLCSRRRILLREVLGMKEVRIILSIFLLEQVEVS